MTNRFSHSLVLLDVIQAQATFSHSTCFVRSLWLTYITSSSTESARLVGHWWEAGHGKHEPRTPLTPAPCCPSPAPFLPLPLPPGTGIEKELEAGASRPLRCADAQRALRLCVRVQEAGWLWSGGFALDTPGDLFIKIRWAGRGGPGRGEAGGAGRGGAGRGGAGRGGAGRAGRGGAGRGGAGGPILVRPKSGREGYARAWSGGTSLLVPGDEEGLGPGRLTP